MMRRIVAVGLAFLFGAGALADYLAERKAAVKLVRSGKYQEAFDAFMKMAEETGNEVQKSDALEQAALAAHRLNRYDDAIELAKQIPLERRSKACRLNIMDASRKKSEELLAAFKDEDFSDWPPSLAGPAHFARGRAFFRVGQGKRAAEDLAKASELLTNANTKGLACTTLGDTWRKLLKDDDKALEAYRKTYTTKALYKECYAALSIADILAQRGKFDEAHAEFARIDMEKVTHPYWRVRMLAAMAGLLVKEGRKAEAIAKYEEALRVQGINDKTRAMYRKKIEALKAAE